MHTPQENEPAENFFEITPEGVLVLKEDLTKHQLEILRV
jgi:hypothetical protein